MSLKSKARSKAGGRKTKGAKGGRRSAGRPRQDDPEYDFGDLDRLVGRDVEQVIAHITGELGKQFTLDASHELWRKILAAFRQALREGKPINLNAIGTLKPYMMKATRGYDPSSGKMVDRPARPHVKFTVAPALKQELLEHNA